MDKGTSLERKGRTIAIGDVHGCYKALIKLLSICQYDYTKDKVIFLGDLTDRGLGSWQVIDHLISMQNIVHILGNHDMWFLDFLRSLRYDEKSGKYTPAGIDQVWWRYGGKETYMSYVTMGFKDVDKHIAFLERAVGYHVEDNRCFVHGGFDPSRPISTQPSMYLMWDYDLFEDAMKEPTKRIETVDGFSDIFIGHTHTTQYIKKDDLGNNRIHMEPINVGEILWNIDTGCGKGWNLTAIDVETKQFWQVEENG